MSAAAVNPGRATMAHAIERYFNVALYMLVLTGFGTLASTGGLDMGVVLLVGLALLFRGYQLLARVEFTIPERWTNYLTLLYVFVYFADYVFISRSFLVASVHLVLFGMVIRLFSLQKARDHYMLAVLSFLMVLSAAVLTVDSIFLFSFAAFLMVSVVTFVLMEMRHSVAEDHTHAQEPPLVRPYRRMAYVLLATAPVLMLLIMAGSFLVFFVLPRVSSRYLTVYTPSGDVSTGFTDRVQLGRIGRIQQSSTVVMHIAIQNDLQGAYDLKWRGVTLSHFDGKTWSNPFEQHIMQPGPDGSYNLPASRQKGPSYTVRRLHYRVLMEPLGTNVFFLADRALRLRGIYHHVGTDAGGAVFNLDIDHPIGEYEADSELPLIDQADLRSAPNSNAGVMDDYLSLPPIDLRVARLAEQITESAPTNYDKAVAVQRYLLTHFGYTLELAKKVPKDPIAWFLFERKKGHCEYFASSMAVMLRSLHIPSRIVTGFRGGEFNDLTHQYVIRASNAHSWVEVYFPEYGWVSFDPTPAGNLPTETVWSRVQLYLDAASSFWREWVVNYDAAHQRTLGQDAAVRSRRILEDLRKWVWRKRHALLRSARNIQGRIDHAPARWTVGAVLVGLLLILLINIRPVLRALRTRRVRAHPERAPREAAALWYAKMLRVLARRGWRKAPSQTPLDFAAAIQDPALQKVVTAFTHSYEAARFGQSVENARALPEKLEEVSAAKG
jgi:transglutaminase-like putative cysteine protease